MTKKAIPNMFTLGNLACGLLSIIMVFQENYLWAALFVLFSALFDRYDGRIARYLSATNEIGKELDSLADLVSFGVAPSILIFNLYNLDRFGIIGYLLVIIFPLAGAYRLARYNSTQFDGIYSGIPITIAGALMAVFSLLTLNHSNTILAIILLIGLSYLMVSNIKFKKI